MSSIRVNWIPSPESDVVSYTLERADNLLGAAWVVLASIANDLTGPQYDPVTETLFYVDTTGTSIEYYRLSATDKMGQKSAPSAPFRVVSAGAEIPIRVTWLPSTDGNIASYRVERADDLVSAPWILKATVVHNLTGPNYDPVLGKFFYLDPASSPSEYYHVISVDTSNNAGPPSNPFLAAPAGPNVTNVVSVDQNYGAAGALRYQATNGAPIEGAIIRSYKKADFDQGLTSSPIAITQTDALGNWVAPFNLPMGFTYTIVFAKDGQYGPDKIEIIV